MLDCQQVAWPKGAEAVHAAVEYAWPLPRFEAMDFAAAFIAANKRKSGGGIYVTTHWCDHGDLEYRYVVQALKPEQQVTVRALRTSMNLSEVITEELLFDGPLPQFRKWARPAPEPLNGAVGAPVARSARIRRIR